MKYLKEVESTRTKTGGCSPLRKKKWRSKDMVLLPLVIAMVFSQILVFIRHWENHTNDLAGNGDGKSNATRREKITKQKHQQLMGLSTFALSMSSDRPNGIQKEKIMIPPAYVNFNRTFASNRSSDADGIFNGYPIYRQHGGSSNHPTHSQLHCVGETWHPPQFWKRQKKFLDASWKHRSCHFQFLCYDVNEKEFVIYLDQNEQPNARSQLSHLDDHTGFWDVSQTYHRNMAQVNPSKEPAGRKQFHVADVHHPYGVSIGSINGKWSNMGIPRLRWFPEVRFGAIPIQNDNSQNSEKPYHVYTLPASVIMLPFHSLAASNPGHLVWDDFLPLYTLLQIFGFTNDDPENLRHTSTSTTSETTLDLLLIRFVLPPEPNSTDDRGLWAGCDWLEEGAERCQKMLHKFAPLMIREKAAWQTTTQRDPNLQFFDDNSIDDQSRKLVCAKNGLAGIGGLSDHGVDKGHGWEERDYTIVHNLGRGGQLWRFRNHMIRNIGIANPEAEVGPDEPLLVVFSANSSEKKYRTMSFISEMHDLKETLRKHSKELGLPTVSVESYQFSKFTIKEQIHVVSRAAVFVTTCGGGAVTATFLPRGASVLVVFLEKGGVENNKLSGKPARLDWDYFNNLGYLRVSWIPQTPSIPRFNDNATTDSTISDLILHELQIVYEERLRLHGNHEN